MSIRVHGEAKLRRKLHEIDRNLSLANPAAAKAGGEITQNLMRARAPRLTGRLVSRISMDVETGRDQATAKIGSDVPYDPFVQKGTIHMAPRAYGEEAVQEGEAAVVAAMARVFKAALPR